MVSRFLMVMLLFANLLITLFVAATLVIFTVVPTIMAGLYGLCWVMKKMRAGRMGKFGKMRPRMHSLHRYKP
jgi:Flp pilus assembly protein TadB